jgi:hypothetical protein
VGGVTLGGAQTDDAIEVAAEHQDGVLVARLTGQLSLATVPVARHALVDLLNGAEPVVGDLSGLRLRHLGCVAVFSTALRQAGGWPAAKLALFGADPRMSAQLRGRRISAWVPLADGFAAARALVGGAMGSVWWRSAADERDLLRVLAAASEQGGGLAQFVQDWLGALLEYDSTRGSRLVRTLSVYLNCDGDYGMAARVLGVQRSTVRYRLGVIRELTRLDLSDGEIRLFLHAATRALAHSPDSV